METNKRKMKEKEYLDEFILTLQELHSNGTPEKLFKEWPIDVVYYNQKSNHKPLYTQFAEYFLKKYEVKPKEYLDTIKPVLRKENTYKQDNHSGKQIHKKKMVIEKVEAKALFNTIKGKGYPFEIIDYEVPLRATSEDSDIGEIDLVGKRDKKAYLLELKKFDGPNGALLHMILQSYTYLKLLNVEVFKKEYDCTDVIPAIIFFENSVNHKQYTDPRNAVFKELINHLGMEVFMVKKQSNIYEKEDDIFHIIDDSPLLRGNVEILKIS